MSSNTRLSFFAVNAQAEATARLLDGGYFDLMSGEQPESADDIVDENLRLARCTFGEVAFAKPIDGVLRANPIGKSVAINTGVPTWCRCLTREGFPVMDGSVGKKNANATSKVSMIVEGQIVSVTEFKHTINKR